MAIESENDLKQVIQRLGINAYSFVDVHLFTVTVSDLKEKSKLFNMWSLYYAEGVIHVLEL